MAPVVVLPWIADLAAACAGVNCCHVTIDQFTAPSCLPASASRDAVTPHDVRRMD